MLVAILNFLRSWRRYNACLNELYQLGDRELAVAQLDFVALGRGVMVDAGGVA